jgi:hypothetical protein
MKIAGGYQAVTDNSYAELASGYTGVMNGGRASLAGR